MSEIEPSVFTTSILTSKTPLQSASIVNENIEQSKQLNKLLILFYETYISGLQQQNYELKNLLTNQSNPILKFLNVNKEYGIIEGSFYNYHQTLVNTVNSNDQLIKFLKIEVLSPLLNLTLDIKFSELLINNQELQELVNENPINEYKWNTRSVAIFENLKNFKSYERNMIVNLFIGLFNFNNSHFEKLHNLNQTSLSGLLDNFNINSEMENYLQSILNNNYKTITPKSNSNSNSTSDSNTAKAPTAKSHRQSKLFHSADKDKKDKHKLRSRVGSIFGKKRKSKSKGGNDLESIYSNQTASTNLTNLTNLREEDTAANDVATGVNNEPNFIPPVSTAKSNPRAPPSNMNENYSTPVPPETPEKDAPPLTPKYQSFEPPAQTHMKSSNNSSPTSKHSNRDLPIIPPANPENVQIDPPKSPNVIKYSESSDEDEVKPSVTNGNLLSVNKSRHTQYSFESGDDLKNFKTSPKIQKSGEFEFPDPDVNPDELSDSDSEQDDTIGELPPPASELPPVNVKPTAASAPAPPPARKVTHNERRGEIQSQIFHSLPQTRDSIIEPPQLPRLSSQTTGNSLTSANLKKSELFHHDELAEKLIAGLNISNSQILNVNFKQDNLAKSSILGELAFNYQGSDDNSHEDLIISIPNNWSKVINNTFIEQLDQNNFKFNPTAIMNRTIGGIKYMQSNLHINQIPIFIHSIWKYEDHQASLIISLTLNPNFASSTILHNLQVNVALSLDVEAYSASSKPTGSFNKEKNRITWKYENPLKLSVETPEKLIARFMTKGRAQEDESGIHVKFSISDIASNITCNNQVVNVTGNLNAGNYSSNS